MRPAVVALAIFLAGCPSWLKPVDDAELQDVAAKLAKCRAEGRAANSYDAYEKCKVREGLQAKPAAKAEMVPDPDEDGAS